MLKINDKRRFKIDEEWEDTTALPEKVLYVEKLEPITGPITLSEYDIEAHNAEVWIRNNTPEGIAPFLSILYHLVWHPITIVFSAILTIATWIAAGIILIDFIAGISTKRNS